MKKIFIRLTFKALLDLLTGIMVTMIALRPEVIAPHVISSEQQAVAYLQKYGYVKENVGDSSLFSSTSMRDGILKFQRFVGLKRTGRLDEMTLAMMNNPRCGMRDIVGDLGFGRKKRYEMEGSKWAFNRLTYKISKYPKRIRDRRRVDKEIARAFKVWRDETPMTFVAMEKGPVHIDIRFEERQHGDAQSFDGPGWTLAHATAPKKDSYVHFDDEEEWAVDEDSGMSLFQVATHEIGHSLGLLHSEKRDSLMYPFYNDVGPHFTLEPDDVDGIQNLYGSPTPNLCSTYWPLNEAPLPYNIDAATRTEDGRTYIFQGKYYWEIVEQQDTLAGTAEEYPKKISDDWSGYPGDIDAALTWSNGQTFFFKRDTYWRFRNKKMDLGYPKLISEGFEGIPTNIDSAFVWKDKTYFFKGNLFWEYDSWRTPPVAAEYPIPISNLHGVPDYIDAALQWADNHTYLFKGWRYYRLNNETFTVDPGKEPFPGETSVWWFDCMKAHWEIRKFFFPDR